MLANSRGTSGSGRTPTLHKGPAVAPTPRHRHTAPRALLAAGSRIEPLPPIIARERMSNVQGLLPCMASFIAESHTSVPYTLLVGYFGKTILKWKMYIPFDTAIPLL